MESAAVESLSFLPCLTGPVDYPFASRHKGLGSSPLGGYLCETGILLLVLSGYITPYDFGREYFSIYTPLFEFYFIFKLMLSSGWPGYVRAVQQGGGRG
jgi:hypothetical protein